MIKKAFFFYTIFMSFSGFAQKKLNLSAADVSDDLKKDVHKIIVDRTESVDIINQNILRNTSSETTLVLDKEGVKSVDLSLYYDKLRKIKSIETKLYDATGVLIKTFKEKDFSDASIADGFSIFTDDRIKYISLDYYQFPFFIKFDYEVEQANTISIPSFAPIQNAGDKVLNASFTLRYPEGFVINKLESNIGEYNIRTEKKATEIKYEAQNLFAPEYEELNIRYIDLLPLVRFGNDKLSLGNVKGNVSSWNDFGTWYFQNFLEGQDGLSEATVLKMQTLTQHAKSDIEKAKIIFDYVQNNTRYISVQVGLGGWKPFPAKEVDKLGYGDCKALTNYTKALLSSVGVTSYYTIIHASGNVVDINEKIISLQGNHAILTIPSAEGEVFLECTSQKIPFGYLGTSTDNRKALVIKPDGAYFVKTYSGKEDKNVLSANFQVDLRNRQRVKTNIVFNNKGSFYNEIFSIDVNNRKEMDSYLKNLFSSLKNMVIVDYKASNDKEHFLFKEEIRLESDFLGSKMGNDYLITVSPFLNLVNKPKAYKTRTTPFSIQRGKTYEIMTEFLIPEGYSVSQRPEIKTVETKFGFHSMDIQYNENKITVTEKFILKTGDYSKEDYTLYQKFVTDVRMNNNSKFIISKI